MRVNPSTSIESIFVHQTSLFSFSVKSENFLFLGGGGDKLTISFSTGIRFLGFLRGLLGKRQCQPEPQTKSTILLLGFVK